MGEATCAVCALESLQVAQSKAPLGWWLVVIGLHNFGFKFSPLATEVSCATMRRTFFYDHYEDL